ncbi:MAG: hypothetical protein Q8N99_07105 [Nanoarchaeota archaeon]|nr:hypothetical protein [Nanoarchaeota archaeon]
MVFSRHVCDKCMSYMKIEKIGEDYILHCPGCEKRKKEKEWENL